MLIPGVSSIIIFELPIILADSTMLAHSLSVKSPIRIFCELTIEFCDKIRLTNCSLDISKLNIATGILCFTAIVSVRLSTNAVLPTEGLAAISIRSDGCSPDNWVSSFLNPVSKPVIVPLVWAACSILSNTLRTICLTDLNSPVSPLCKRLKISFSVSSNIAGKGLFPA